MRYPFLLCALVAAAISTAGALPMAPNLEEARATARAEGRTILLELTGKDWCPGCIYLKNRILDSEVMERAVGDRYIVVELDYPRDPKKVAAIPEAERRARADILKHYRISGLPCIIYMDSDGLPFAVYSQYTQSPEEYIETIMAEAEATRSARDAALARAATMQGMEKAQALAEALNLLPESCRSRYTAVLEEIHRLDPQDNLGCARLRSGEARRLAQLNAWEDHLRALKESLPGAPSAPANVATIINACEAYLQQPDLLPELRQDITLIIADGYAFQRNIPLVYATLHRALAEAPQAQSAAAARIRSTLEYYDRYLLNELGMTEAAHQAAQHYRKQADTATPAAPPLSSPQ